MAITANRDTQERAHPGAMLHQDWVAVDSDEFYIGQLIAIESSTGKIKPGATATGLVALGRCEERFTTGASNTRKIKVRSGLFKWANSAGDALAAADEGALCYIEDDSIVCKTATGKSAAGRVYKVESDGVWVLTLYPVV